MQLIIPRRKAVKDRRVVQCLAVLAVVLLVIGVSGLSGAQAQTATVSSSQAPAVKAPAPVKAPAFPNAPAGTAYLTVTGSALKPRASDITFATVTGSSAAIYCTGTGTSYPVFNTPVHLPQGTVVNYLRMYFYDNDPAYYCTGYFSVYDLLGNVVQEWSASSPTGSVGTGLVDAIINHTIDNTQYTYLLNWVPTNSLSAPNSNLQLRSLQLNYAPPPSANKAVVIPLY
jgi:hypothetical protein